VVPLKEVQQHILLHLADLHYFLRKENSTITQHLPEDGFADSSLTLLEGHSTDAVAAED
jgi:hypothetical protein